MNFSPINGLRNNTNFGFTDKKVSQKPFTGIDLKQKNTKVKPGGLEALSLALVCMADSYGRKVKENANLAKENAALKKQLNVVV